MVRAMRVLFWFLFLWGGLPPHVIGKRLLPGSFPLIRPCGATFPQGGRLLEACREGS